MKTNKGHRVVETIELDAVKLELLRTLNHEDLAVCIDLLYFQPSIDDLIADDRNETNKNACTIYRAIMELNKWI